MRAQFLFLEAYYFGIDVTYKEIFMQVKLS
jgi:hypothetical protein